MKTVIKYDDTECGPWTIDDVIQGKAKPIFQIETKKKVYVANSLDSVMRLWQNRQEDSEVISVNKIG